VIRGLAALLLVLFGLPAQAYELDGATLGWSWVLPFAGVLLSIALLPLLAPSFWHRHDGKIATAWAACTLLGLAWTFGASAAWILAWHAVLLEYLPFIIFVAALYVVAGGIHVGGELRGSAALNTGLLAVGALLANLMGTTGAAMLLIRPLIRANEGRAHQVHTVVFFIFLVANIGGSLTPLGDPPLFLGFLQGVDFFWTTRHLALPMAFALFVLLGIFYFIDARLYRKDPIPVLPGDARAVTKLEFSGLWNFGGLAIIVATIILTGLWKTEVVLPLFGVDLPVQDAVRCTVMLLVASVSFGLTPNRIHHANHFTWEPVLEVARLFFGIFVTMAPVLLMLKAGSAGTFAPLAMLVNDLHGQPVNAMYFWLTGLLSSLLDNAPTYLVFFNLAGADAHHLMHDMASTLTAISAGAVFMGANTYIGNAPNFMVKAIAQSRGVRMPGFFGYMAWSGVFLVPVFVMMTWLFF
jgi:Na+/H+ antiporter NhaD/arsenite permease-like protein